MVLQLEKAGHRCTSIRGDLDHQLRDRVVNEFRTGITKILIATDVLSRGFDVTQACALSACQYWFRDSACPEFASTALGLQLSEVSHGLVSAALIVCIERESCCCVVISA